MSAKKPPERRLQAGLPAPLVLFALNAFITLRLFHSDYIAQMPSIDGAFIGLARYIRDHFPDLSWMPLWYGGIPFPDCYPPLLHTLVAAVSGLGHISAGLAYHAVAATLYSLGPVTLYWAAQRLGANRLPAFLACLGYSLLAPSIWLGSELRHDIGGWFAPCRLDAMVRWGEGPHIASLTLLPLAIGLLHLALQRRQLRWYFAAAAAMAAVALSNWLGGMALALVAGAYLLAGFSDAWLPLWARLAAMAVWAYALAAPFVTPSTVVTIQANAPIVAGGYKANHLLEAAAFGGVLLVAWALRRLGVKPNVRFALLLLFFTGSITLCAYWFKLWIVPQPERYHLEMDMAFWLAMALIGGSALSQIRSRNFVLLGALLVCIPIAIHQYKRAQEIEKPIAIGSTVEYEISHWLGANRPGQRVFAPGTVGFWMLAFSDTPMLTGGFDNGMRNTFLQDVNYQIYAGDRQDTLLAWLKAFGVAAVVGGGRDSREFYHPYAHPEKFAGMSEIWRDGGDVIYSVPRGCQSLAHGMDLADLPAERPPAYYVKPLERYLAALDEHCAGFQWIETGEARIMHNSGEILSIQIAWDKGWSAYGKRTPYGERVRLRAWQDKLGQMVVNPEGFHFIDLVYDGGLEQQGARWLSAIALLAGLVSIVFSGKRVRS